MSLEDNKRLVRMFLTHACNGEIEKAIAFLSDEAEIWMPTDRPDGLTVGKRK